MSGMMSALFDRDICRWFDRSVGSPTQVQREGWPVIASGRSVLISAPTGTGKTLTAFLMMINRLHVLARENRLENRLYCIYITPLKALGNDIRENLKRPVEGIGSPIRTAIRCGDTPANERQKMQKNPPHILITTPESLYLMLTSAGGRKILRTAETVIVDEFHAVLGGKRGTHLLLSLTRLDALCGRNLQRIGLSATIRPLKLAAECLAGKDTAIVAPVIEKKTEITVNAASADLIRLNDHSVWPQICREIYEAAQQVRTVLVFCEGRATTEKVAFGVNSLGGEGFARTHHGSMSKEQRLEAEQALKAGELKVLCATSSMELGIDVGEVDLVIQVGCPARIASAVQRLGRAGHRPGEISRMRFYPRMDAELLLAAMTADSMRSGQIEAVEPPMLCLDILAQHLVSMAAAGEYSVEEALSMLNQCTPYRELTEKQLTAVLGMLAGDDEHDADRPTTPRVEYDRIHGIVRGSNYSRMLAVSSGGTIPDRGMYAVYLEDGKTRLGELDEEFVFEARLGDKFLLGAFAWRIVSIERDRVLVRSAGTEGAQTPFWRGDGVGRDYETGKRFGGLLRRLEEAQHQGRMIRCLKEMTGSEEAAQNTSGYIMDQLKANGCLATDRTLVMEYFEDESGEHQMMLHCPYGGRVNQGLAVLLKAEAEKTASGDVRVWHDDDGVLMHITGCEVPEGLIGRLRPEHVKEVLWRELPKTAQFTIAFRYNMYRALMMGVRPGGRVPLWVQRMRGAEALTRAVDYPAHPILQETMKDCLNRFIDADGLTVLLKDIHSGRICLIVRRDGRRTPSPMTLSLRRQIEAQMMYEYAPVPEVAGKLEVAYDEQELIRPEPEQLAEAHFGVKPPDCAGKLHEKLMIEGDLFAEETDAPYEWMQELVDCGRSIYIEPGLWIAAEQEELYRQALTGGDEPALARIIRRCLRYRGRQEPADLCSRYDLPQGRICGVLDGLLQEGTVLLEEGYYCHAETYRRAQKMTIAARRRAVRTAEPAAYAAFLPVWQAAESGSPKERLAASVRRLYGLYLPIDLWERVVLPARTSAYRPQMIDDLLSCGETVWRLNEKGDKLAFFPIDAVEWEADAPVHDQSEEAAKVRTLLERRGASFLNVIAKALPEIPVIMVMNRMALAGDVVSDRLNPLRDRKPSPVSERSRLIFMRGTEAGGRWEIARPVIRQDIAEQLNRTFDRWGIVCRETAAMEEMSFSDALSVLRQMEYTGLARRGYFVRGMSGAQFVRAEEFERIQALLHEPDEGCICLNASDPAQAWGKILGHDSAGGCSFLSVPGTVLVLDRGRIAVIIERQGSVVRSFTDRPEAFCAFADAFRAGRIYPHLRMLTVRTYPKEAAALLEAAGFVREMKDYVLTKG